MLRYIAVCYHWHCATTCPAPGLTAVHLLRPPSTPQSLPPVLRMIISQGPTASSSSTCPTLKSSFTHRAAQRRFTLMAPSQKQYKYCYTRKSLQTSVVCPPACLAACSPTSAHLPVCLPTCPRTCCLPACHKDIQPASAPTYIHLPCGAGLSMYVITCGSH
jgi:hypothetical protein